MDKVLVALSGGVDSCVCAHILLERGYEVIGLVLKMSDVHEKTVESAKIAAKQLNIPLIIKEAYDIFHKNVIVPFSNQYLNGKTPNPCILCNPSVKFQLLFEAAAENDCKYIATGHYASISESENVYYIRRSKNLKRDQSYMLYGLNQNVLSMLVLPIGDMQKDDVRKIAESNGYNAANAPDSQEICFIPDNNYSKFIEDNFGKSKIGSFISPGNEKCGKHNGIVHYTVGQRKGLGISLGKPVFIKEINGESGDIYLTYNDSDAVNGVYITDIKQSKDGMLYEYLNKPIFVKIRSTGVLIESFFEIENENLKINFNNSQKLVSKGQSAVIYHNDIVLGGGIIDKIIYS